MDSREVKIRSPAYPNVISYINSVEEPELKSKFLDKYNNAKADRDISLKLGSIIKNNDLRLLVFSASWCKDCQAVLPSLARIQETAGVPISVLGGIKVNLQKPPQWRAPPSPPEVNELLVQKIPAILILDKNDIEIARAYEQPPEGHSLEDFLLNLIQKALNVDA